MSPSLTDRNCDRTKASVLVSSAEKQSSSSKMGVWRIRPRAKLVLCFCPADKVTPRSPINVDNPALNLLIVASSWADRAACQINSSDRSGLSNEMFSEIGAGSALIWKLCQNVLPPHQ
jgi:hypothetical protein